MPEISVRGLEMPESPIRKLAPLAVEAKRRGIKVYHLNIGQPDLPTPQCGLDALKKIDRTLLEYSPSQGYLSYREKLCDFYKKFNINVKPDDIIITAGGSEAVLYSFMACLNPGDEIIVPEPAYANYMAFAISAGAKIKTIATSIEEGFALPKVEKFEELINEKTRAIMICNPNNPTGYLYTRREMNQIRDLVKKYDLYLFSDEVYREYIYTGSPYISAMHLQGIENNTVLIDSVSKRYSECGIRIGALITKNEEIRKAVMKFCQARLSPPLIGQIVAEASLDAPASYYRDVYDEYVERRKCLIDGLNRIPGVYSPIPMGAFYTVAKLPVDDSDKFCRWCLEEFNYEGETVMMAPASGFYTTPGAGRNQVRIAYVLKREDLQRALVVLQKALEAYPGRVEEE
ncbi:MULTISPECIES: pyridoxal phosphate-dependent aminotransferase [Prevotella]|jgi:aminotransferase, class I/II|uniref:Aspartate aminotransferase n=1 Tax=Prevotella jejuni TaxID=1177574 RepID=A0A2K9HAZ9_9BACT|nr:MULTISPECIES: pyridoxal phosphate-dependent aminotransferase [Prevotella]AUI55794.1 pyridoxal phosphate-dependent aminotransferase [Prevotella jejuni]MBW4771128.1 pyridoxal phosphate-dependent aminotransferase [Prevotella jejuni]PTL30492.1 pyridoxal phosphate-dependent aminotransferase [Prevotella sp. oral taxon 313]QUB79289.1 pyridoxal phosphate-dependent aminotransferase [Prevotella jejuni]QUB82765.1 pyridoxal phosphate-dependent aminotransferase [Prevotella jejuni]